MTPMNTKRLWITRVIVALGAFVVAIAASCPGFAQSSKLVRQCSSGNPPVMLEACSKLLALPRMPQSRRAIWLNNRGVGWQDKKEWDLALADYDELIRLGSVGRPLSRLGSRLGGPR